MITPEAQRHVEAVLRCLELFDSDVQNAIVDQLLRAGIKFADVVTAFHDYERDDNTDAYREAARRQYQREGEIEVDDNAYISHSEDGGAYVMAWVWVSNDDAGIAEEEAEEEAGSTLEPA